ncbi:MAG: hypothetical protein H8E28_06905 [Anaerolineae bacterium]|nr:hypothetical protein [Anaerolineae bacterium]
MNALKNNHKLGATLAIVGILTGLLILFLMASIFNINVDGKIADGRPDEAITVQIAFSTLSWLGVSAGALWVAVLYGFINKTDWAWFWGTVAATVQLLVGFFPMIPPSSIGLPAPTVWVFALAFVLWFGMLFVGGVPFKIMAFAFASGLAYVLTYIDGVGAISRFQTEAKGFTNAMYGMSQMVNWWGAAVWAVFIFALIKNKAWALPVGVFAAAMSMFGGFPVGITDVIIKGRFSMFLVAPVISTGLLIYMLLPKTKKMLAEFQQS